MAVAGYFADSEGYFAVPVQNRSAVPDTFWVGRRNYLVLGSDFGERSGELRDFGPEVHAVLGPLPYRDKSDILHVLIETESSFAFQSLTSNPRTKPLDGPHLAAGNQSYFSRLAYPSVLDDEPVALQIEAGVDRILLPLAFSETTGSRNEGTLLVYVEGVTSSPDIFSDDTSRVFRGSLYWHSGVRLFNLQATLQFRSRYDIIVYQIGKALFAGSATTGVLHRWDCI
ncbi:hypothetical protein SAMN05428963_101251 [Consotaella salsifontis]|uniref:Uncharacterized protein n=2 Tax=Consotaella salsifontis TaxID=1365950 RepID=A0A1T4LK14_9HYPH|nr:hypothetical protein SAMN05428963_101251 [Consotaella salsifontis]